MRPVRIARHLLMVAAMLAASGSALSQQYPTRPIRILAAEPGGGNDFLARIVAPPLSTALGQTVIVDNRASRAVGPLGAIATPDGYTVIIAGSSFQAAPLLEKVDYHPVNSFVGISQLDRAPNVLVVNASLGVNTVKDLIALAKAKPGALNYGSGGAGSSLHLGAELFKMATGVNIVRVAYKSSGPALTALLGNEVQVVFAAPGAAVTHVKSGKLKALAVTSAQPTPLVQGVPTFAAVGVPGVELESISFMLAPVKTPASTIARLNQEVVRLMGSPEVKAQLMAGGSEAVTSTSEQITKQLASDDVRLRKLFKAIGIGADSRQ